MTAGRDYDGGRKEVAVWRPGGYLCVLEGGEEERKGTVQQGLKKNKKNCLQCYKSVRVGTEGEPESWK